MSNSRNQSRRTLKRADSQRLSRNFGASLMGLTGNDWTIVPSGKDQGNVFWKDLLRGGDGSKNAFTVNGNLFSASKEYEEFALLQKTLIEVDAKILEGRKTSENLSEDDLIDAREEQNKVREPKIEALKHVYMKAFLKRVLFNNTIDDKEMDSIYKALLVTWAQTVAEPDTRLIQESTRESIKEYTNPDINKDTSTTSIDRDTASNLTWKDGKFQVTAELTNLKVTYVLYNQDGQQIGKKTYAIEGSIKTISTLDPKKVLLDEDAAKSHKVALSEASPVKGFQIEETTPNTDLLRDLTHERSVDVIAHFENLERDLEDIRLAQNACDNYIEYLKTEIIKAAPNILMMETHTTPEEEAEQIEQIKHACESYKTYLEELLNSINSVEEPERFSAVSKKRAIISTLEEIFSSDKNNTEKLKEFSNKLQENIQELENKSGKRFDVFLSTLPDTTQKHHKIMSAAESGSVEQAKYACKSYITYLDKLLANTNVTKTPEYSAAILKKRIVISDLEKILSSDKNNTEKLKEFSNKLQENIQELENKPGKSFDSFLSTQSSANQEYRKAISTAESMSEETKLALDKYIAIHKIKATLTQREQRPSVILNNFSKELQKQEKTLSKRRDSGFMLFVKALVSAVTLSVAAWATNMWKLKGAEVAKDLKEISMFGNHARPVVKNEEPSVPAPQQPPKRRNPQRN